MNQPQRRAPVRRRRKKRRILWDRVFLLAAITLAVLMGLIFLVKKVASSPEQPPQQTAPTPTELRLPDGWKALDMTSEDLSQGTLVLVNADHAFDPDAAPDTACLFDVMSENYFVGSTDLLVAARIAQPLNQWLDEFYRETEVDNVNVVAGYRTEEYQQGLRDNAIAENGLAYANQYIALPKHSEHHTGYAIDLDSYFEETGLSGGFDGSGVYQWLVDNAWKYGFIQRYPLSKEQLTGISYEQWHFRFVGQPHAQLIAENNWCLEEYIDNVRAYSWDGQHLLAESDGTSYEIYFCAGLQVVVPTDRTYEISGNNVDGFIVTIKN